MVDPQGQPFAMFRLEAEIENPDRQFAALGANR
jgi:hypothetical protein